MRYVVFTDIDDTLFFDMKMNPKNVKAIEKARENGHIVFINTGRSTGVIQDELMHGLFDGVVASIGAEVYVGEKILYKRTIDKEEVFKFATEFFAENRRFIFEATVNSPQRSVENTDKNPLLLIEKGDIDFTKLYIEGHPTKEQVKRIGNNYQLYVHPWYFEFTTKGCTKATGMQKVLDYYGVSKENCISIGDSVNDVEMLKASGIPVCVDNAVEELKKISVYKACHAKDGALYDCFSHFGLI